MTETLTSSAPETAAAEPAVGAAVTVFAGTDDEIAGHIVDDFGDDRETESEAHTVHLDRPKRWAVHTEDGLLIFADTADITIAEDDGSDA